MIRWHGRRKQHCDGVTRRSFLCAGTAFAGLSIADLLRLEASQGIHRTRKAIINVHLDGGPPHQDMIDLKPDAPAEVRGEFRSIGTSLSGFRICELMPRLAERAHQFAFIRSLVGAASVHDAFQCQSGYDAKNLESIGGRPAMGSVIHHLLGSTSDPAPSFVDLMQGRPFVRNSARPGFLGPSFSPFRPDLSGMFARPLEDGMKVELARRGADHATELTLNDALNGGRLADRQSLLDGLDRLQRDMDASGMMDAMDQFQAQASGILTSGKFAEAMNLELEDPKIVERFTPKVSRAGMTGTCEGPESIKKFLLARRLVEAGVRCVSLSFGDFDTHSGNFSRCRYLLPALDFGLAALIDDLHERGMLDDVSIVIWGEFGRTPKINNNQGGRDHWPRVGMCMLAGGAMNTGQVIGATDRLAGEATERPVSYQEVFATLYHRLGIDLNQTTILDPTGRPQYLLDHREPIRELV